ncbi:hypothetical protein ASPNIDRAFT_45904 [Aspergillus niger ATCC 1015]|uniref:Uncharacterized protein n=1 Tax=Aspergillus niger (strain ATCC 1015 / CBS 113.46 / FGSC A1144 / LSHB Ac4 / NCTC 3858a / NRRL 328 / USDA 3528.7) TaxID=380704 RepID=G3YAC4_ASPNA|nr:hypothetical protein ASPNIDRAFT_45904 [Aspergillus niger ATCC 1015]
MFRIFNYPQPQPHLSTSPPTHHNPSPIPDVRVEIPSERLPGITYDDLPLLGARPSSSMLEYHQLPVLRHLDWRIDDETGEPLRRPLKDVVSLTAAFAQTRGCEPLEPYVHCRVGKSVWKTCVVGFDTREGMGVHGACAACRFSRRGCSLNTQLEEPETPSRVKDEIENEGGAGAGPMTPPPSGSRRYLAAVPVAAASRGRGRGGSRRRGSRFIRQRPYNLRPRIATPTPSRSDMGYNSHLERGSERRIKSEKSDLLTSSPGTSRLDGSILPFPLGPETIDDLPFLRQAVTEMEMHLGILRRRVRQLEDRERVRNNSIDPWELV